MHYVVLCTYEMSKRKQVNKHKKITKNGTNVFSKSGGTIFPADNGQPATQQPLETKPESKASSHVTRLNPSYIAVPHIGEHLHPVFAVYCFDLEAEEVCGEDGSAKILPLDFGTLPLSQ